MNSFKVILMLCSIILLQIRQFHCYYFISSKFKTRREMLSNSIVSRLSANDDKISDVPLNSFQSVDPNEVAINETETPEEKYKREKLEEIAERKAAEVFVTRDTGKYECQSCGYVYDTAVGFPKKGIKPGTPFDEIEKFRCPQCGASKKYFVAELETLSGFKENLKYGFGGNAMTASQKSNLIFGGLFLGFIIFLSGYLLE